MLESAFNKMYKEEQNEDRGLSDLERGRLILRFLSETKNPLKNKYFLKNLSTTLK